MLKFLQGRQHQPKPRISIKKYPQIAFGISLQAPTNFQSDYSMFSTSSYVNPFVDYQKKRTKYIPASKLANVSPNWIYKTDINQIEQGKVVGTVEKPVKPDRYHEAYHLELSKNHSRFRLTKGEFTNYLERNHSNNQCFGPLIGQERSEQKSLQTKRSGLRNSFIMLQKSRDKLQMSKTLRKESSKLLNKVIDQRRGYRRQREEFYRSYQNELSERKSPRSHRFALPRVLNVKSPKASSKHEHFGILRTIDCSMLSEFMR